MGAERDGGMQLHPPTAVGLRYLQELRGHVTCCFHGRQWCGDAWACQCLRTKRGDWRRRQEEVMDYVPETSVCQFTCQSASGDVQLPTICCWHETGPVPFPGRNRTRNASAGA